MKMVWGGWVGNGIVADLSSNWGSDMRGYILGGTIGGAMSERFSTIQIPPIIKKTIKRNKNKIK